MLRTTANTLRTNLREIASDDVALREMGYRGLMGQFITLGGASVAVKEYMEQQQVLHKRC